MPQCAGPSPVQDSEIESGEEGALLEIVSVPDTIPGVTGANVTFTAVDSPAARVTGEAGGTSTNCPGLGGIALIPTPFRPGVGNLARCGGVCFAMFSLPNLNGLGRTLQFRL